MKNSGITWKSQVSGWVEGAMLSTAFGDELVVLHHHGGHQPVAEDHGQDGGGAQEVDHAVAVGGGGGSEGAGVHATSSRGMPCGDLSTNPHRAWLAGAMASDGGKIRQLRLVVHAEDYEEALRFYRDVLGMPSPGVLCG